MLKTWVVVADSSRARIFQLKGPGIPMEELHTLAHPEGRLHERELQSDRPGRAFDSRGNQRHAMGQDVSPAEQEQLAFGREIRDLVEQGRNSQAFDRLYLVAPPVLLGVLRKCLGDQARKCVEKELGKNLVQSGEEEIRRQLAAI